MSELDFKAIGLKIKERRQQLGITQEHIANVLDVNPSHILFIVYLKYQLLQRSIPKVA